MADKNAPLIPEQGWHCLHLFYRIDFAQWQLLTSDEQRTAKIALSEIVQEIRATEKTQLLTLSVVTPKADIAFMLITPDLHAANSFEKRLNLSLGAGVLRAGLQLSFADRRKRIHNDGRAIRRDARTRAKSKTRHAWSSIPR